MQKNNYAPLIEFHGYVHSEFMRLKDQLSTALKKILSEDDYKNLTFSELTAKVVDTERKSRPFLRLYSSEYVIVHKIHDILESIGWEGEMEFIKITQYHDLRKKKK